MTFGFWVQGLYCFVAGLCLLLIKINGDVCTAHNALLRENLDQTITVRGVQSVPLGIAAVKVLTCDGKANDSASKDNNFVDIFQMGAVFDMSTQLQSASEQVTQQQAPLLSIKTGVANVTSAVSNVKAWPMNINGTYDGTVAAASIAAALPVLPAVFNRDNGTQVGQFQTLYLSTDQTPFTPVTWQWTGAAADSYQTKANELNAVLSAMSATAPTWYAANRPYSRIYAAMTASNGAGIDFNTIASLMNYTDTYGTPTATAQTGIKAYFCGNLFIDANTPPDNIVDTDATNLVVYNQTGINTAAILCTKATAVDAYTVDIDKRVNLNTQFITDATALAGLLPGMTSDLSNLTASMVSMAGELVAVNTTLAATNASIDASAANLVPLSANILGLNSIFLDANQYSMCGFVGTFFRTVYKDTMCTDVQSDVRALAGPILAVALIIFIGFMLHGCFAPALRKRPEPSAALFADSNSANSAAAVEKEEKKKRRAKKRAARGGAVDSGEVLLISSAPNTPSATPMADETSMFATGSLDDAEAAAVTTTTTVRSGGSPSTSQHLSNSAATRRVIELPVFDGSGHHGGGSSAMLDSPRSDNGDASSPTSKPLLDASSFHGKTTADV
jgi:hypothetical protein